MGICQEILYNMYIDNVLQRCSQASLKLSSSYTFHNRLPRSGRSMGGTAADENELQRETTKLSSRIQPYPLSDDAATLIRMVGTRSRTTISLIRIPAFRDAPRIILNRYALVGVAWASGVLQFEIEILKRTCDARHTSRAPNCC